MVTYDVSTQVFESEAHQPDKSAKQSAYNHVLNCWNILDRWYLLQRAYI